MVSSVGSAQSLASHWTPRAEAGTSAQTAANASSGPAKVTSVSETAANTQGQARATGDTWASYAGWMSANAGYQAGSSKGSMEAWANAQVTGTPKYYGQHPVQANTQVRSDSYAKAAMGDYASRVDVSVRATAGARVDQTGAARSADPAVSRATAAWSQAYGAQREEWSKIQPALTKPPQQSGQGAPDNARGGQAPSEPRNSAPPPRSSGSPSQPPAPSTRGQEGRAEAQPAPSSQVDRSPEARQQEKPRETPTPPSPEPRSERRVEPERAGVGSRSAEPGNANSQSRAAPESQPARARREPPAGGAAERHQPWKQGGAAASVRTEVSARAAVEPEVEATAPDAPAALTKEAEESVKQAYVDPDSPMEQLRLLRLKQLQTLLQGPINPYTAPSDPSTRGWVVG